MPNVVNRAGIILASKSPRRRRLLEKTGLKFKVIPSRVDESSVPLADPDLYVKRLAEAKAGDISDQYPDHWVIGADTIVFVDDTILGKPASHDDARTMLTRLRAKTHQVHTGYCIQHQARGRFVSDCVTTDVSFRNVSDREIDWYIDSGEPFGKAGAYAIQGIGTFLVKRINGSYPSVVGLPVCEVMENLIQEGVVELMNSRARELGGKDTDLKDRLQRIHERIKKAAAGSNRSVESIKLIAVSKTKPAEIVREAIDAGVTDLGENYIQEAREKVNTLAAASVNWHFIGHLQSNKAKYAVRLFDLIHSVDTLKLANEINKYAQKTDKTQSILVQVNVAREDSKSGVYVEDTIDLLKNISQLTHVAVKGLMTMPPYFNAPDRVRPLFAELRELRDRIEAAGIPNIAMDELSMGMTGDFEAAIEEGATLVRIGTAIFGERN